MARWIIDRTINLDFPKTVRVLQLLLESPRKDDSSLEKQLMEEQVLKNGSEGALRRRWYTYLRNYGLLKNDDVTEMGTLYASKSFSLSELALLQMIKRRITLSSNVTIAPFKVLVKTLISLYDLQGIDATYLSQGEFSNLVVNIPNDSEAEVNALVRQIIEARTNNVSFDIILGEHQDIWFNNLKQTGLFDNYGKTIFVKSDKIDLLRLLSDVYDHYHSIGMSLFMDDFVNAIPAIQINNVIYSSPFETFVGSFLYDYFFVGLNNHKLAEKYFKGDISSVCNLLNKYGIEIPCNRGVYSGFISYPNVVAEKLTRDPDVRISALGRLLKKYTTQNALLNEETDEITNEEEGDNMGENRPYIELNYNTNLALDFERNRIVFGAPGTGKSFKLEEDRAVIENLGGGYERVTFHPDYSYSNFVGCYKPVSEKGKIEYKYVPGPFMRVLVEALRSGLTDEPKPYLLIIEEINRAKVAAVFGEVFQLLDRDSQGKSDYEIHTSEDVKKYLSEKLGGSSESFERIRIPNNMFIWASMNSADQGVFPMDTAFKRRWSFEYKGIDENEDKVGGLITLGENEHEFEVNWNVLRKAINEVLAKKFNINEDKLMGPFFMSEDVFAFDENGCIKNPAKFKRVFKSKVIMYLYEDAAKQQKHKLFAGCDSTKYSSICDAFDKIGIDIFGADFKDTYKDME